MLVQAAVFAKKKTVTAKEAAFIKPMDCLPVPKMPKGSQWIWEIKLDGYRAVAVKSGGSDALLCNRKSLNNRFFQVVEPLRSLADG